MNTTHSALLITSDQSGSSDEYWMLNRYGNPKIQTTQILTHEMLTHTPQTDSNAAGAVAGLILLFTPWFI